MHFSTFLVSILSFVALSAHAANITIIVGQNGTPTYTPNNITAKAGDVVEFVFATGNHTVTQSTFPAPCQNMSGGIDSGFVPVAANSSMLTMWSFTVLNDTTPLWFYCRQANHCSKGMVFAVNPTATKTFAQFQSAAMGSAAPSATPSSGALAVGRNAAGLLAIIGLAIGVLL